jgi:hypothetical protein
MTEGPMSPHPASTAGAVEDDRDILAFGRP